MSSATVEKPRTAGPGSGLGGNWRVIVRNDNHNTFDHVAQTLARVLPGVSLDQGHRIAEQIHNTGQAIVWTGPREPAEHYWEMLDSAGPHDGPARAGLGPPSATLVADMETLDVLPQDVPNAGDRGRSPIELWRRVWL